MTVSLPPAFEAWVESRVKNGLAISSDEVVREALQVMILLEQAQVGRLEELKALIDAGLESAEAGRVSVVNDQLIADIKRQANQNRPQINIKGRAFTGVRQARVTMHSPRLLGAAATSGFGGERIEQPKLHGIAWYDLRQSRQTRAGGLGARRGSRGLLAHSGGAGRLGLGGLWFEGFDGRWAGLRSSSMRFGLEGRSRVLRSRLADWRGLRFASWHGFQSANSLGFHLADWRILRFALLRNDSSGFQSFSCSRAGAARFGCEIEDRLPRFFATGYNRLERFL